MHAPKPRRGFPALPDRKCERNGQCPPASILNWYKVNFIPTEQPMDSATDASSLTWYKMDIDFELVQSEPHTYGATDGQCHRRIEFDLV
jgi:hypothetical protein